MVSINCEFIVKTAAYLADVSADLARPCEEDDALHPFFGRQASFPREIMEMGDETFKDVLHAGVRVVGVNEVNILSDVVGVQIL